MQHSKAHYKTITHNGYQWYGFIDGIHKFTKHVKDKGYLELSCTEDMLSNGDFEFMAEHGLTLSPDIERRSKAAYRLKQKEVAAKKPDLGYTSTVIQQV